MLLGKVSTVRQTRNSLIIRIRFEILNSSRPSEREDMSRSSGTFESGGGEDQPGERDSESRDVGPPPTSVPAINVCSCKEYWWDF